mgnify:FL=1
MEEEYLKNEPLKNVIDVLEEISKINNIEMYILSLSKTKKITEKKKIWLKKYVPFIKEENWIILTKEIGDRPVVICGRVSGRRDHASDGMTRHSWVQIGGRNYDPEGQFAGWARGIYGSAGYRVRHSIQRKVVF